MLADAWPVNPQPIQPERFQPGSRHSLAHVLHRKQLAAKVEGELNSGLPGNEPVLHDAARGHGLQDLSNGPDVILPEG